MRRVLYGLVILLAVAAEASGQTSLFNGQYLIDKNCTTCQARVDHYGALVVQPHISGAMRAKRQASCGTTATMIVGTDPNRRDLYIQNLGGPGATATPHSTVFLGFGTTGHVALTAANGWALHAMTYVGGPAATTAGPGLNAASTQLILKNYSGPLYCIAVTTGPLGSTLGVLEVLR